MEALNREKALVPPVVLTLPKHLRGVGEAQLEALSNKLSLILQALQRERQSKTDTMLSYILLLLLLQQQHIREQQQYLLLLQQQQQQQHFFAAAAAAAAQPLLQVAPTAEAAAHHQ